MGTEAPLAAGEVERKITAFLQGELLGPGTTVGRDDDLLSGGLLDSIGALRLAAFVEEAFQFTMPPGDFVIENFRSVAALAGYVQRATEARPAAGGGP